MPIYQYECDCGESSEQYRSMKNLVATCESCGLTLRPKPSLFSGKIAGVFTVVGHHGKILDKRPMYERLPMMSPSGREY